MENELELTSNEEIRNMIYTVRGKQVMLDSDVAMLYKYTTKRINETVRRNIKRFPENFCFQLDDIETKNLRSQFATLNKKVNNGEVTRKYLPYVFTEQGIAMLSGLLRSEIAIQVSIKIMNAFVEMRKFLIENGQMFNELTEMKYQINDVKHQLSEHNEKFDKVFDMLQHEDNIKQRIFYQGQIYDAYILIVDIIKKAESKIVIIDNYIDESVLKMLSKK